MATKPRRVHERRYEVSADVVVEEGAARNKDGSVDDSKREWKVFQRDTLTDEDRQRLQTSDQHRWRMVKAFASEDDALAHASKL